MATRMYWHNTSNATTGLPTTKQTSQTVPAGGLSQSVNKNMTTTIGTSQTSLHQGTTVDGQNYMCRWVSDALNQSSITANTWTISFAAAQGSTSAAGPHGVAVYVWRPSSTTKIGTVFDSTISLGSNIPATEQGYKVTFSGSAIASGITANDVLCVEFMIGTPFPFNNSTADVYYDGTTAIATNNTSATSAASYLETPENLTFVGGGGSPIDATVTAKVNTNKIIVKG